MIHRRACASCNRTFDVHAGEVRFAESARLPLPSQCRACRPTRRAALAAGLQPPSPHPGPLAPSPSTTGAPAPSAPVPDPWRFAVVNEWRAGLPYGFARLLGSGRLALLHRDVRGHDLAEGDTCDVLVESTPRGLRVTACRLLQRARRS